MNTLVKHDFNILGLTFPIMAEQRASLLSSSQCVLHVVDQIRMEYPTADITQILVLTSLRLGDLLCTTSLQKNNSHDEIGQRMQDCELFIKKLCDIFDLQIT